MNGKGILEQAIEREPHAEHIVDYCMYRKPDWKLRQVSRCAIKFKGFYFFVIALGDLINHFLSCLSLTCTVFCLGNLFGKVFNFRKETYHQWARAIEVTEMLVQIEVPVSNFIFL